MSCAILFSAGETLTCIDVFTARITERDRDRYRIRAGFDRRLARDARERDRAEKEGNVARLLP
jgi:hypothetical protein